MIKWNKVLEMLTALFVQITIMSAALGIISHKTHLSDSHNPDNPISLLEALLQRMYANNSKPYESNITEILGPKYEEFFKELLEGKKEMRGQKAETLPENNLPLTSFTTNTSAKPFDTENNTLSLTHTLDQNTTDTESDLLLENDDELQPIKTKHTLNESVKESNKENSSKNSKESLSKTFTENLKEKLKEHPKEKLRENLKESIKGSLREHQKDSFEDSTKGNLHNEFKESPKEQRENFEENLKESLRENKVAHTEKEHHNPKGNFTEQKLNQLAELEQVLRYFTQLIDQHPGYISSAKSAVTNSTDDTITSNITSNETEETSPGSQDLTETSSSSSLTLNLTDILNQLPANVSNDLNWYKPESKNLSHFTRNSSALINKNSHDTTTDQNIELFQNFFSYRKIPYPVLSVHPLLTNWTETFFLNNSTALSGKTKPKHSWMHSGSSNNSFHIKNSLIDPISKAQIQLEKPANLKTANESACLFAVNTTKVSKTSAFPATTTTMISKMTVTHSELLKIPPLPNFNSRSDIDPADLLRKCWTELNKTKSEIRQHERQKPDAITCIIPRQNTSIFWGPEPVSTKSSGFYKFFNKKEKKDKKKKVTCRSTTPPSTLDMKAYTKPPTISTTHKVRHELDHKNDHNRSKENELYDEGLNKILEDISSKMCLPNIINGLLELVCQNGTNSSLTSTHPEAIFTGNSLRAMSENHRTHNHNHNHSHALSATRLGGNDHKTRRMDQSNVKPKPSDNSRLKNYMALNYLDKSPHQTAHQRLKLEGNEDIRDLSNLLFFIGMNKNENSGDSSVESNLPPERSDFDVAYMKPQI